jgi:hypothetical protein
MDMAQSRKKCARLLKKWGMTNSWYNDALMKYEEMEANEKGSIKAYERF